jgi:L-ribulose-5-phosphate 3-epimerase
MTQPSLSRRSLITAGAVASAATVAASSTMAQEGPAVSGKRSATPHPPVGKKILLSCKLGMITKKENGKDLTLVERLKLAAQAGFDGVDFDEAGSFSHEQARDAVMESGVFVHNAINHAHWNQRLTSPKEEERAKGVANLEHCVRVSHAAGGSAVLLVIGSGGDGPEPEIEDRARKEIQKVLPLAASLGQQILFENVWNKMHYDHDAPPEQSAERFIKFVDSFNSNWIGMYYDIGNHWKYGQPREWLNAFGRRAVKLDVKGFSRAKNQFVDITSEHDDVPWSEVQKGLAEIGFSGWTTAEVGGGGLERLTTVRKQMEKAFGLS